MLLAASAYLTYSLAAGDFKKIFTTPKRTCLLGSESTNYVSCSQNFSVRINLLLKICQILSV